MALSAEFIRALEQYKFERKHGTVRSNRDRLLHLLGNVLLRNTRLAFPSLCWHTLWRLAGGSLALVICPGEARRLNAWVDSPSIAILRQWQVLEDAAGGTVWVAPVSSRLVTESDPAVVAHIDRLAVKPPRVMRELRRIYRLHYRGRLLYGYLAREREAPVEAFVTCLGKPGVEVWRFGPKSDVPLPESPGATGYGPTERRRRTALPHRSKKGGSMSQQNSHLRITSPASCAQLGLSICPGKVDPWAYSGPCVRDLVTDVETIRQWGANHVVTLLEGAELEYLQVPALGEAVRKAGMAWHHWEVIDGSALRTRRDTQADQWREECAALLQALDRGEKIFIHCRGGLGRTGTLAARLLIARGLEPEAAIREVRAARPGAIETEEQEEYLREGAWLR